MADYKFTAALNASDMPVLSRSAPRSVLIGQLDGKLRSPTSTNTENRENNQQGIPQIIYAENVMPTREGVISVGYTNVGAAFPSAGTADDPITIFNSSDGASQLLCPAGGFNYIKSVLTAAWVSFPLPGGPSAALVSTAYVNGKSYICYDGTFFGHWDNTIPNIVNDVGSLVSITPVAIRAICASGNYMIAIRKTDNAICWSSLINPLDFTPDATTGAGAQIPVDMHGIPIYLTPLSTGFLIHCTNNIIAATYTQNAAQPWIFREVRGSGGIVEGSSLSTGINKTTGSARAYAYTSNGIQSFDLRDSDILYPNVGDFLADNFTETFDPTTKLLTLVDGTRQTPRVAVLANRFICLSYGVSGGVYDQCLIYDAELKRWGKLRTPHAAIFYYPSVLVSPHDSLFVLTANGQLKQVELTPGTACTSVIILGRYQLNRANQLCSQELELELLNAADVVTATVASNYNGTTVGSITPMLLYETTDNYRHFQKQVEGENLSFIIEGTFHLSTAIITATKGAGSGT